MGPRPRTPQHLQRAEHVALLLLDAPPWWQRRSRWFHVSNAAILIWVLGAGELLAAGAPLLITRATSAAVAAFYLCDVFALNVYGARVAARVGWRKRLSSNTSDDGGDAADAREAILRRRHGSTSHSSMYPF